MPKNLHLYMISKRSLLPKGSVILVCLIFAIIQNWELIRRRSIMVAQRCDYRNPRKEAV